MAWYTLRPLSDRTPFRGKYVDSRFRDSTWTSTLDMLRRELAELDANHVILEADYRESDLRLDGTLRANAKCASPAVRIAFESKHGPLTYATDRFIRPPWGGSHYPMDDWQYNVRAIALSLEALRKVDRYGVTKRGEQYTGWKAITAGVTAIGQVNMDRDVAMKVIAEESGYALEHLVAGNAELLKDAMQRARKRSHPDKHHGDNGRWNAVDTAIRALTSG